MERLVMFDIATVFKHLAARGGPVSEVELLKFLTGKDRLPERREELYALHFSLYHALYLLRRHELSARSYLHLDPMRIRLIALAGPSSCGHYFPHEGRFCGRGAESGGYCSWHAPDGRSARYPVFDPMDDFYSDPANISFGRSELLGKLMRGVIVYSLRRGEVDDALRFFGMVNPSRRLLQKRYYELARLYHPDLERGNDGMMKQLNRYYQVLREIFIV